jgi:hypothetical protein
MDEFGRGERAVAFMGNNSTPKGNVNSFIVALQISRAAACASAVQQPMKR